MYNSLFIGSYATRLRNCQHNCLNIINHILCYTCQKRSKKNSYQNTPYWRNSLCFFAVLTNFSFLKDYQKERLNFLRPCERYSEDSGYQLCNSLIAFKNGGLKGKGIGESTQKYLYLPEAHTDFIYPIIVEEWGLIVGIIIILIYLYMLYRMIKITKNAHTLSNSIIGIGVTSYFFLHIVINLLGVMGLAPLTGVPLPFLSYGGSYTLTIFFAMGLIQRVNYETYKHNNKTTHSKKKRISTQTTKLVVFLSQKLPFIFL